LFLAPGIFRLQKDASTFFQEQITNSPEFTNQDVILVDFKLKDQSVEAEKVRTVLTAELTMTYGGTVIDNFSDVLPLAISLTQVEYLLRSFVQKGFFEPSSTSSSIRFENTGASIMIANSGIDSYLIIFVVLLTISSVLAFSSIALICVKLLTQRKRRRSRAAEQLHYGLKITETEESNELDSPGVLGARVQSNGQVMITPQRNIRQGINETPMSQDSNMTAKSIYSTASSKAPLGILSMNNLKKLIMSPQEKKHSVALYNVGLDESDEVEDLDNAEIMKSVDKESEV
jgi:hypothetical protein